MNAVATPSVDETKPKAPVIPAGFKAPDMDAETLQDKRKLAAQQRTFLEYLAQYFSVPPESFDKGFEPILLKFDLLEPHPKTHQEPLIGRLPFGFGGGNPIEIRLDSITTPATLTMEAALQMAMLAKSNPHMKGGVELTGSDADRAILAAAAEFMGLKVLNGPKADKDLVSQAGTTWKSIHDFATQDSTGPSAPSTPEKPDNKEGLDLGAAAGAAAAAIDSKIPTETPEQSLLQNKKWAELTEADQKAILDYLHQRYASPNQKFSEDVYNDFKNDWDASLPETRALFLEKMKNWQPVERMKNWRDLPAEQQDDLKAFFRLHPQAKDVTDEKIADQWDNYFTAEEQNKYAGIANQLKQMPSEPAAEPTATPVNDIPPPVTEPAQKWEDLPEADRKTLIDYHNQRFPNEATKPQEGWEKGLQDGWDNHWQPEHKAGILQDAKEWQPQERLPNWQDLPEDERNDLRIAQTLETQHPEEHLAQLWDSHYTPEEQRQVKELAGRVKEYNASKQPAPVAENKPEPASTTADFTSAARINVLEREPSADVLNRLHEANVSDDFYKAARKSVVADGKITVNSIKKLGASEVKARAVIQAMIDEGFVREDKATHQRSVIARRDGTIKSGP